MPEWLVAAWIGAAAFALGVVSTLFLSRGRRVSNETPVERVEETVADVGVVETPTRPVVEGESAPHVIRLLSDALRGPIRALRRSETPAELVDAVERVAWQGRMLAARPRPLQARPVSPITLLQEAAEEIEALRLGKVGASWGLFTRQPVYLDPGRSRAAFRELFQAAVLAAGEGGRIAVRIHEGQRDGFPVSIEIEVGRRGVVLDPLACLVARRLLESQGARIDLDDELSRVELRSFAPDPEETLEELDED